MFRTAIALLALLMSAYIAPAKSKEPQADASHGDIASLAEDAYVWGMPLVEAGRIRERFTSANQDGDVPGESLNHFKHRRLLSGPEMKAGVGPNNDTIYSLAWIDLSEGPLVVTTPDFGDRYYTISMNFADSSSDMSIGQRTHGGQLPPIFMRGPDYGGPVPDGFIDVPARTRYVNVAGRILVRSADEYPLVNSLQDEFVIHRWSDWKEGLRNPAPAGTQRLMETGPDGSDEALTFYYRLGSLLQDWYVHPEERGIVAALEAIGITRTDGFRPDRLTADELLALREGFETGKNRVLEASLQLGSQQNGWTTNYRGPRFGTDWLLRAAVAKDQIYVAIPEEAVYPIGRVDAEGKPLDGSHSYRIHFPCDALPPVDAFWSITAYDDKGHMMPNPIGRYSVGDRTEGLVYDADGGVSIILSADRPADEGEVNWLPVTIDEPFYLMMRLYLPQTEVLEERWSPPAIEEIG